jgi:hypothetical protein
MDLERAPAGGVAEASSRIACLAAECPVERERIQVWLRISVIVTSQIGRS